MKLEELKSYEIIEQRRIEDLNSMSCLLRHKKTGARVTLLSNDDENKVFYIGFRTPPTNSTGVAHILEHSVLCGSEKFPVKDPFVELVKGSLNTFLNAMTYPDKTVYPVASCNDKDFQNLVDVYLDAVLHPNIYQESRIFQQEGWHYEMQDEKDELRINGVVYNEMKGAFSSPEEVLSNNIFGSLYPDNTYHYESGGDPQEIPELTYEQFLQFHERYYHPSNSFIYLYGNMDMAEKLDFIDKEYLSAYDYLEIDSAVTPQEPFGGLREINDAYSITEEEPLEGGTYLAYSAVVGDSLDRELEIAFNILDYALCSAPGAPLKQALIDKGIGKDVYSYYADGILQPYFAFVAKNAETAQKEEFISTIESELAKIAEHGFDKKALLAGLNYFEFKYREADFGTFPKGLMYGLQILDSWLYDDSKPFIHVEANATFAALKQKVNTPYFQELIRKYLIDNTHKSVVVLRPERGLAAKREKELAERLSAYKESLGEEQVKEIVANTRLLREYQETDDTKENMEKIPLLTRADLKKEAEKPVYEIRSAGNTQIVYHDLFTNGIGYIRLLFDLGSVPERLFPYVGLLKTVLGLMDTENYGYKDLYNEINIRTGGLSVVTNLYQNSKDITKYKITMEVKAKALYENLKDAFLLSEEIILKTKYEDYKRLKEILEEAYSQNQTAIQRSSHTVAVSRALSYQSETAAVSQLISGIDYFRMLEKYVKEFDTLKEGLVKGLQETAACIFRPENLLADYASAEDGYGAIPGYVEALRERLYTCPVEKGEFHPAVTKKNEGFACASQVQYVCRVGNYRNKGLQPNGSLRALKVLLGYDYLWNNIRVKGGAYGCMCGFGKFGESYFVSYRDPNLEKTLEVYEKAADYVAALEADERMITQYIIGALSETDMPMNASAKAVYSLGAYLTQTSYEEMQRDRDELLSTSLDDIHRTADYIRGFMADDCLCVIGEDEKIKENSALFQTVEQLFG